MSTSTQLRAGGACGAVFAVVLTTAVGNGSNGYSTGREVAGLAALVLFLPFLACLGSLMREAEGGSGWLSTTALVSGVAGITLKLSSAAPSIAAHRAHVGDGTRLHDLTDGIASALTVASLAPLAVLCAAVAAVALRTGVLPRWLAYGAAVTAAGLAVNAAFLDVAAVPALLLFVLWTLLASAVLLRRSGGRARASATLSQASARG